MALNFRTLDLNLLRVLDAVMAEGSLTRAAVVLAMTQPAVSHALRRLREAVGEELFVRTAHGMKPTPLAETLWPQVRDALATLRQALAPGDFDPRRDAVQLRIAMADATAALLAPRLVAGIEAVGALVNLRVLPLTTRDPRRLLDEGKVDLAVGHFPSVLADLVIRAQCDEAVAFAHQRLYDGQYVCVMRAGHPLARGPFTLDKFCAARHMLVSFSGRPYGFIDESLASLGRKRQVVLTVNQFFTAGRVVANSNLLTVLPQHFVSVTGIADQLVLRPLPFDVAPVHVDALWHARLHGQSAHQWLRHAVFLASKKAFSRINMGASSS